MQPASSSCSRTARQIFTNSPRRWPAASACSTTTATAGSTSTAVQGGTFPPVTDGRGVHRATACFATNGDGTFEDVTGPSGIAAIARGYGHGVAVGDYDNDGRPDLFVTRWRSYALYRNRGDGTFEDVTGEPVWAATAAGRRRRPSPTSTTTATSTSTSAITSAWEPRDPLLCPSRQRPSHFDCDPRRLRSPCRTISSATTAAGSWTSRPRPGSSIATAEGWASSRPTSTRTGVSTCSWPTTGRPTSCSATWAASGSRRSAGRRGRGECRGGIPGGDGGRLRRPRRRRPARPGRHELLRRVDDLLPEPGLRALRRPHRGHRPGRRRAGTSSASAWPSSTPTTTAGSTC